MPIETNRASKGFSFSRKHAQYQRAYVQIRSEQISTAAKEANWRSACLNNEADSLNRARDTQTLHELGEKHFTWLKDPRRRC